MQNPYHSQRRLKKFIRIAQKTMKPDIFNYFETRSIGKKSESVIKLALKRQKLKLRLNYPYGEI